MELTKAFSAAQHRDALEAWEWIGLDGKTPLCSSLFGDTILRAGDGFWFLDVIAGSLEHAWVDKAAMEAELATDQGQDKWLLGGLAMAAEKRGIALTEGQVYDFTRPPALGGTFEVENVSPMDDVADQLDESHRHQRSGTGTGTAATPRTSLSRRQTQVLRLRPSSVVAM